MPLTPSDPRLKSVLDLHQAGRLEEAGRGLQALLAEFPDSSQLRTHLGALRLQQGRPEEALVELEKAAVLGPGFAPAQSARAQALERLGRRGEALEAYGRAIALGPEAWLYFNQGNLLRDLGRPGEAVESYGQALRLRPDLVEALTNRGALLLAARRAAEALCDLDRALSLRAGHPDALNNRGNALRALGRPEEALSDYDQALASGPGHADTWNNRGIALQELGRLPEALEAYDRAAALDPGHAFAHWNKSQALLLTGKFEEGWRLFEWRWKSATKDEARAFDKPLWLGEGPLEGKTLLVWAEQGMGDILQYARYLPLLEKRGARAVFEVPRPLFSLLKTLPGKVEAVEKGSALPHFDLQCPLISLPLALGTALSSVPADLPYLFADPAKAEAWGKKLGPKTRPRVGLAWSGRPEHSNDHHRSIPLEAFGPLLEMPLEFHSLQKDLKGVDLAFLQNSGKIRDHRGDLQDFSDTAALLPHLDLVVSVDSSPAHLAGAMGRPLWVLVPFAPDYRWLLGRDDSPWYPQARLLRQPKIGDWGSVVERVRRGLLNGLG